MKKTNLLGLKKQSLNKQVELLQKPSGTISIAGDLSVIERKFYNKFLQNAKQQLEKDINRIEFDVSLQSLKNSLDVVEDDKNNNNYKKVLKKLFDTIVTYNILDKDKTINGAAHLLDNLDFKITNETKELTVFYTIPSIIRRSLVNIIQNNPENLYAKINLAIIKGLKSKYSIILYEICKDYQNAEIPEMTIEQFKRLFGIENQKTYQLFFFKIRERVLDTAVKELNENPNVEFTVGYKLIKQSTSYTSIKFFIKYKSVSKPIEETRDNQHLKILINAVPKEERTSSLESYLSKCLKSYDARYLLHQIEYVAQQKPKSFFAYLKKAIEEDYAKSELVEEQEKAEKARIENIIKRRLEKLEKEKEDNIDRLVGIEKIKIYEEYIELLEESKKQELFKEYKEKTKELHPDVEEKGFFFEELMKRLITEDIIAENKIYQIRLEKARIAAQERAEIEYNSEKKKLDYEIENGLL